MSSHPDASLPIVDITPLREGGDPTRNQTGRERLSYPFFFDPDFTAEIPPLPGRAADGEGGRPRWDGADVHAFAGTYGDYLLSKVGKVFPDLSARVRQLPSGLRAEPRTKDGF